MADRVVVLAGDSIWQPASDGILLLDADHRTDLRLVASSLDAYGHRPLWMVPRATLPQALSTISTVQQVCSRVRRPLRPSVIVDTPRWWCSEAADALRTLSELCPVAVAPPDRP